jgi:hypothetical protein
MKILRRIKLFFKYLWQPLEIGRIDIAMAWELAGIIA